MKKLIVTFLSICLYSNAQTIEKKYSDFELISNAKSVTEIKPMITNLNQIKGLDKSNLEQLFVNPAVSKVIDEKFYFNEQGFILQNVKYYSGDKEWVKTDYLYNVKNKLTDEVATIRSDSNNNYKPYYDTKIERINNTVTFTTKYSENDTLHTEIVILEKDLIVQEKTPHTVSVTSNYTYNEKNEKIKGIVTLASGEKLIWTNEYEYYPNGKVKIQTNHTTDLNQTIIKEYYENGLIKVDKFKDKITSFDYFYDNMSNWIFKIEYKNSKLNNITKREIVY